MISEKNFFYELCALRIAKLVHGREIVQGGYGNYVRQYAKEWGDPALGEASDMDIFGPIDVLWRAGCLELWKLSLRTLLNVDFSKFPRTWDGLWEFLGQNGFHVKLTPEGLRRLNEMEAAIVVPKPEEHKTIGFHAKP